MRILEDLIPVGRCDSFSAEFSIDFSNGCDLKNSFVVVIVVWSGADFEGF